MKTTKTIITAILLCFFAFANAQQKKELTKEETLKYVTDTYNKSWNHATNFSLDGKILVHRWDNGDPIKRIDLRKNKPLEVAGELHWRVFIVRFEGEGIKDIVQLKDEDEAKRVKNALEHLIKLLKAEPETDPFAN